MSRLQKKRGRKSNYLKFLNSSEYWAEVRRKALFRSNFQCEQCSNKLKLEVHHTTYWVNGINIVGKELEYIDYMMVLCEKCHKKEHKKRK